MKKTLLNYIGAGWAGLVLATAGGVGGCGHNILDYTCQPGYVIQVNSLRS